MVNLVVPKTCLGGSGYSVAYSVVDPTDSSCFVRAEIEIIVLGRPSVEIAVLSSQAYVIAGESHKAVFAVSNRGNVQVEVKARAYTGEGSPAVANISSFLLSPGESEKVSVAAETDVRLRQQRKQVLKLQVTYQGPDGNEVAVECATAADVLPLACGDEDVYIKMPLSLTTHVSTGTSGLSLRTRLAGSGTVDEERQVRVSLAADIPTPGPQSSQGGGEYRMSLTTDAGTLHVGDRSFSLTPLTQTGLSGRGIEASMSMGRTTLGFYSANPWGEQREAAWYVKPGFETSWPIKLSYLERYGGTPNRPEGARIWSASTKGSLGPGSTLELEWATSHGYMGDDHLEGTAWRAAMSGEALGVRYFVDLLHADPDYMGAVNDTNALSLQLKKPIGNSTLWAGWALSGQGNSFGPGLFSTLRTRSFSAGFTCTPGKGSSFSASYRDTRKQEQTPDGMDSAHERVLQLRIAQQVGKVSIAACVEPPAFADLLSSEEEQVARAGISLAYAPSSRTTLGIHWQAQAETMAQILTDPKVTLSVVVHNEIRPGTWLEANLKSVQRHGLSSGNHVLTLACRTSFGLPVARKTNVGTLTGRVYDSEDPARGGIPNVIIWVSGLNAVTDRNGTFTFPSVPVGPQYLSIDRRSIGAEYVTVQPSPMPVTISGGSTVSVDIGIARGASVTGRIARFGREHDEILGSDAGPLIEKEGLRGILVELADGTQVLRRLTDPEGEFAFSDLPPGRWVLTVRANALPGHHYIEQECMVLDVLPGERRSLLVRVLPKARSIVMLEETEIP
jgi:hypothetical protein